MNQRTALGNFALDGKSVTSKEIFERETSRIFTKNWLCAGHVSQLFATGNQLAVELDAQNLLLTQAENGRVQAFHNICRHRGARLMSSCERADKSTVQCPYHAWTYGLDGKLISAPNMHDVGDFCLDNYSLKSVRAEVWHGLVWIHIDDEAQDLASFLAPLEQLATDWSLSELVCHHTFQYEVDANWKLICQNYNECYHCPSVHPALNRLTPYQGSTNHLEAGPILGGPMRLADDCETMSTNGKYAGQPLPKLADNQLRSVSYFTIFPNTFFSPHPDYVLLHRLGRLSESRTSVHCDFLFHPDAIAGEGFSPGGALEFWDQTNLQDWHVCELTQQGMADPHYVPGPYSNLESVLAAFDRHYQSTLNKESKTG